MSASLKELIAAERAARAAGLVVKPAQPLVERVMEAVSELPAQVEHCALKTVSDYLSARDKLKEQRMAAGYRW